MDCSRYVLRKCRRRVHGQTKEFWQLVESHRTQGGRQRVVAYLGDLGRAARLGMSEIARGNSEREHQTDLFREVVPQWVEVDAQRVRVERSWSFGGVWLGLEVLKKRELVELRRRCVAQPTRHQAILLTRLSLELPAYVKSMQNVVEKPGG